MAQVYSNIPANQGLWTNPVTGHLMAGNPLLDIDVSGVPGFSIVTSNFFADGLTVSLDGRFVYGSSGTIVDLTTGAIVGNFGSVSGADGMGTISSLNPILNGNLIVNTTTGNIVMVDRTTFAQTIIASGGGYGDYTSPDFTNGTLLVSSVEQPAATGLRRRLQHRRDARAGAGDLRPAAVGPGSARFRRASPEITNRLISSGRDSINPAAAGFFIDGRPDAAPRLKCENKRTRDALALFRIFRR